MKILRPPPGLGVIDQAKAQGLAGILLVGMMVHLSAVVIVWTQSPETFQTSEWAVHLVSVAAEIVALALTRTRHYPISILLLAGVAMLNPLIVAASETDPARLTRLYAYAGLGNLFVGLFVRPYIAVFTTAVAVTTITASAASNTSLGTADVYGVFALVLLCGVTGCLYALLAARTRAEREVLQQRMMLADRLTALGSLVGGIGAELQSPLTYVRANLEYLQLRAASTELPQEASQALDDTVEGVERMTSLVNELRRFSAPSMGTRRAVDLDDVLQMVLRVLSPQLRRQVELEVESTPGAAWVRGEAHSLEQVLFHLIANAAAALEGSTDPRVSLRISTTEDRVRIEVSDNGPGVDSAHVEHIFEPFFSTRAPGQGTGLGLALCQRIVSAHQGSIHYAPSADGGARFVVELPMLDQVLTPPPSEDRGPRPELGKVLLIDDEPLIGRALARSFPEAAVTVADQAEAAMTACETHHFDLVLCDLNMPEKDGRDLYEQLLEAHPLQAARVVFMTGGATPPELARWLRELDVPVLYKPIDRRQLVAALEALGGGPERPTGRRVLPRTPSPSAPRS